MSLFKNRNIYLIDGSSVVYRSYYAHKNFATQSGITTGGPYGVNQFIKKLYKTQNVSFLLFVFDTKTSGDRRKALYADYKSNRPKCPEDIIKQFELSKLLLDAWRIKRYDSVSGEADDTIGTLSKTFSELGFKVYIVSSDKDLFQLLSENVSLIHTGRDWKLYTPAIFSHEYGIECTQMLDLLTLSGDTSDNIPGVKGLGPKTAVKLLTEYKNIDNIMRNVSKITPSVSKKIQENVKIMQLSKDLATIYTDLEINIDITECAKVAPDKEKLKMVYKMLEFQSELRQMDVD